mgnify:CR=1 FL=1
MEKILRFQEISTVKMIVITFQGKMLLRSKICIENSILEQVNSFNYLGYGTFQRTKLNKTYHRKFKVLIMTVETLIKF